MDFQALARPGKAEARLAPAPYGIAEVLHVLSPPQGFKGRPEEAPAPPLVGGEEIILGQEVVDPVQSRPVPHALAYPERALGVPEGLPQLGNIPGDTAHADADLHPLPKEVLLQFKALLRSPCQGSLVVGGGA